MLFQLRPCMGASHRLPYLGIMKHNLFRVDEPVVAELAIPLSLSLGTKLTPPPFFGNKQGVDQPETHGPFVFPTETIMGSAQ